MGRVSIPLARPRTQVDYDAIEWPIGRTGYQPSHPESEQNPPQSMSGIFTYEEAQAWERAHPFQSRITMQEVADALSRIFIPEYAAAELASGVDFSIPRYIDSSDGIASCGYEEL